MPSVLANDFPVVTLQADNIQVRAEWKVVGDDADHFRVEGGTLMLRPNISAAGKPEGVTITAIVEVLDKFSTLNPSYEDLTVRVMITAVIMGCHADWTRRFAISWDRKDRQPPNQLVMEGGSIKVEDVIVRRYAEGGYNYISLYTVTATHGTYYRPSRKITYTYFTTSPSFHGYLRFDQGVSNPGYNSWPVNGGGNCFDEEIETLQEQNQIYQEQQQILQEKTEYLNAHAPLISGFYAGKGRAVTVGTAFVYDGKQHFYLYNVTLANILNEIYTPKVIVDDGKAFSIDNKYQIGNRYEYVANLTVGSGSVQNQGPHEVIIVDSCPPIYEVDVRRVNGPGTSLLISASDLSKAKAYLIAPDGNAYKASTSRLDSSSNYLTIHGYSTDALNFKVKFSDHFLCENIGG